MKVHPFGHIRMVSAILLSLLLTLILSGCSATEAKANILYFCGIISEEERQAYTNMVNNGQLDSDGSYVAEELNSSQEFLPPEGSVHVTFAENAYIDVQYYLDADLTEPVDLKRCYLMPGGCIYASEPVCNHPNSKWYEFDRFCIYAYDETGERTQELSWADADAPLLVCIPSDYIGSEVSVVPMGKYENRTLELTDYCVDSTNHNQELAGTWIVNGKEVSSERIEISPIEPLVVDFRYDSAEYAYDDSNPRSFYHDNGLVRFETTFADSGIEQYSVKLRPLEGVFRFDPSQYVAEHGTVTFRDMHGNILTEETDIPDGDPIYYSAVPAEGYLSANADNPICVSAKNPDETYDAIKQAIRFYRNTQVSVNLPRPTTGGLIEYTDMTTGKILSGKRCTVQTSTHIAVKLIPWKGWDCPALDVKEYLVEDEDNQTVHLDGLNLDRPFIEGPSHKPHLQVVLTDSLKDTAFRFDISASGLDAGKPSTGLSYDRGDKPSGFENLLNQNDRVIFDQSTIGTEAGIAVTATGDVILSGDALKFETVTKCKNIKGSQTSIQYIGENEKKEKTIELYSEKERPTSPITYESITIKISLVKTAQYTPKSTNHATVTIRLADENDSHILQPGEVLESSRNVEVTITPENGYYITGSKLNSGVYSETMKYSKWEKDYQKILDRHPAQKLWYVTLDTSDDFGTCVYKLDGVVRSGRIAIRDGQKLTLEYTLTNPNYQISRAAFWESTEAKTATIPIDESLDGRTIQRSDYITIERKEG